MQYIEEKENRVGIQFFIIPLELHLNENLTYTDKILFATIQLLDNEEHCFASNFYLSCIAKVSEGFVSESISNLIKHKLIELVSFDGRKRVLRVNPDWQKMYRPLFEKFNREYQNGFKDKKLEKNQKKSENSTQRQTVTTVNDCIQHQLEATYNGSLSNIYKDNNKSLKEENTIRKIDKSIFIQDGSHLDDVDENPSSNKLEEPLKLKRRSLSSRIIEQKSLQSVTPPVKAKIDYSPSPENKQLIDLWNSLPGLHYAKENTKYLIDACTNFNKLRAGTFFNQYEEFKDFWDVEVVQEELIQSIINFHKATTDKNYYPVKKEFYQKRNISQFIYDRLLNPKQSLLLDHTEDPVLVVTNNGEGFVAKKDEHPVQTQKLISYYNKKVMGGVDTKLTVQDKNRFITAVQDIYTFTIENKSKFNTYMKTTFEDMIEYFIDALNERWGNNSSGMTLGSVVGHAMVHQYFPSFLVGQNVIEDPDSVFSGGSSFSIYTYYDKLEGSEEKAKRELQEHQNDILDKYDDDGNYVPPSPDSEDW